MSLPGEIEDHKKAMDQYNEYKVKICMDYFLLRAENGQRNE
jgi:hypothetical protein